MYLFIAYWESGKMDQLGDHMEQLFVYEVIIPGREEQTLWVWSGCLFGRRIYTRLLGNTINLLFT